MMAWSCRRERQRVDPLFHVPVVARGRDLAAVVVVRLGAAGLPEELEIFVDRALHPDDERLDPRRRVMIGDDFGERRNVFLAVVGSRRSPARRSSRDPGFGSPGSR